MSNLQRAYETDLHPSQQMILNLVPASPLSEAAPPVGEEFDETEADDLWAVWPYSWAVALYHEASDRFHSFHEKQDEVRLARHNQRQQEKYRKRFWRDWDRGTPIEGSDMRMV